MRPSWIGATVALLVCLLTSFVAPPPAYAQGKKQSVEALIKKGQEYFDDQRYEESIQTLSAALLRPGIAKEEKIQVFTLLAYNYIVLNRTDEADGAVRGLLVLDENYALPESESPRFRDFFKSVRDKWIAEGKPGQAQAVEGGSKVKIKHTAPAQVEAGSSVRLEGTIEDPDAQVAQLILYYRASSDEKFQKVKAKYAMRKFTAEIPADVVEPPLVEYYLTALDNGVLPVASFGDAESPARIAVPESGGVLTSPWFWIPVSVAVVAAVVIPVVIVTTSGGESTVTVNVFDQ
jgi:hypothetical protein